MHLIFPFLFLCALIDHGMTVVQCPQKDINGPTTVQFCSKSFVTSSDIYIDSSEASTRATNCTCTLNTNADIFIYIKTTSNQTNDCRSRIKHGFDNLPMLTSCTEINIGIELKTFQIYILTFINEEINIKNYCLHLFTGNNYKVDLKCYSDRLTISDVVTTNGVFTITDQTDLPASSLSTATRTPDPSDESLTNHQTEGPVLYILLPTILGSLLLIGCIILVGVVYIRRCSKKKNAYESSGTTSDLHVYENHISTTTVEENNGDVAEYENCNFNKNCTDLTNTTVNNKEGYTELQFSLNHENTMSPSIYTELQTAAVAIDHGYTQLNSDTDSKNQSNSEMTNGDYEKVKATVIQTFRSIVSKP